MPVSRRCPRWLELCYLLVRRSRHSPATIAIWFVAITTRTRVRRLPWQTHDSGESGIATSHAPVRHMISGPNALSSAAFHARSLSGACARRASVQPSRQEASNSSARRLGRRPPSMASPRLENFYCITRRQSFLDKPSHLACCAPHSRLR